MTDTTSLDNPFEFAFAEPTLVTSFHEEEEGAPDPDKRYCACGCGTEMSKLAKGKYIRGHKLAGMAAGIDRDDTPNITLPKRDVKVTKKVEAEIQAQLEFYFVAVASLLYLKDPICGEALESQSKEVVEKLLPLIVRSPALVEWFTRSDGMSLWVGVGTALLPVAQTVWSHHVTHSIGESANVDFLAPEAYSIVGD